MYFRRIVFALCTALFCSATHTLRTRAGKAMYSTVGAFALQNDLSPGTGLTLSSVGRGHLNFLHSVLKLLYCIIKVSQ